MKTTVFKNYAKVSVILEAWKMKFGQDATVIRLVGGIQAMEMQVMIYDDDDDDDDDDADNDDDDADADDADAGSPDNAVGESAYNVIAVNEHKCSRF